MEFSKPNIITWFKRAIPVFLGAAGGYAYYYFIGCVSGTCPITSNPWSSTAYGALIGLFLPWPARKNRTTQEEKSS